MLDKSDECGIKSNGNWNEWLIHTPTFEKSYKSEIFRSFWLISHFLVLSKMPQIISRDKTYLGQQNTTVFDYFVICVLAHIRYLSPFVPMVWLQRQWKISNRSFSTNINDFHHFIHCQSHLLHMETSSDKEYVFRGGFNKVIDSDLNGLDL